MIIITTATACTVSSCAQGEDTKTNGEPRPLREYGSASPSAEGRAHSIEFIDRAIEGLRRERAETGSGNSRTEERLSAIRQYYGPPTERNVPSAHWLEDEDVEAIHRVLGTPVAIWTTGRSRTSGPLIRPLMHMSATEAATFLFTSRTWIEASPSHYTCFGHSVGNLKELRGHTLMRNGTFRDKILYQIAFLLVRASQEKELGETHREATRGMRELPRELVEAGKQGLQRRRRRKLKYLTLKKKHQ
jgi:hypothetical protein